jgi:hypothetical protein
LRLIIRNEDPANQELAAIKGADAGGYHSTEGWAVPERGISLGTAMSISGAAVNPNVGFHTFPPLAFLMTVFNARLGEWLANPRFASASPVTASTRPARGAKKERIRLADTWLNSPEGGPRTALLCPLRTLGWPLIFRNMCT